MSGWQDNVIMTWAGIKVTDHGRSPLSESTERIGVDKRMADGTLRRQHVGVKRSWSVSWDNLPSTNSVAKGYKTVDGGMAGRDIETFYYETPGRFRMVLRRGSAVDLATPAAAVAPGPKFENDNFYGVDVMMTDFSKEVRKRGIVDLWTVAVTLQEV